MVKKEIPPPPNSLFCIPEKSLPYEKVEAL